MFGLFKNKKELEVRFDKLSGVYVVLNHGDVLFVGSKSDCEKHTNFFRKSTGWNIDLLVWKSNQLTKRKRVHSTKIIVCEFSNNVISVKKH